MRVLVIGGTGFIGPHGVAELHRMGALRHAVDWPKTYGPETIDPSQFDDAAEDEALRD